jgi:hypothetical protein
VFRRPILASGLMSALIVAQGSGVAAAASGGWNHLGDGGGPSLAAFNGAVYALNADNPGVLYAGGAFTDAGGHANADYVARWDGARWSALGGSRLNGAVKAIAYHGGKVFVGGEFSHAGPSGPAHLAVWNGSAWGAACGGSELGGSVLALQIIGSTLYVGGAFQEGAGIQEANYLLACDLTTGAPHALVDGATDINGGIYALTADSNGVLYAGGQFINMDGIPAADHVAAYDGSWHAMGNGGGPSVGAVDSYVRALAAHGTDVYVGTDSVNVGGVAKADHVARWNGSTWSAVGANAANNAGWFPTSAFIYSLKTYQNLVFATGSFQNADGVATADEIAYFDGTHWHPIGSNGAGNGPLSQQGSALAVFSGSAAVGGSFINAGSDALADSIASFLLRRPDVKSATSASGPFAGNNVYSPTGAGETRTISVARGHKATVYLEIQNDGISPTAFGAHGNGAASGISVAYFKGSTNVTAAVKGGTYQTASLSPATSETLKMVITVAASSASQGTFRVEAIPPSGTDRDAVNIQVNAH